MPTDLVNTRSVIISRRSEKIYTSKVSTRRSRRAPPFAAVEEHLGREARVYECRVAVYDNHQRLHDFAVFFNRNPTGSINRHIKRVTGVDWRGDFAVFKLSPGLAAQRPYIGVMNSSIQSAKAAACRVAVELFAIADASQFPVFLPHP